MPAGTNTKREREFEELKQQFRQSHRYPGREEEVAARIVNKQRAKFGETRQARQQDRQGHSPDRKLPLPDYDGLTIPQIASRLEGLSAGEIRKIRAYEIRHKNRKGLLSMLERRLKA
ncbi:hypothetical protein SAMN06265795_10929 [Noviherbaspirillum humi]|uniref:DUF8129 domain-containing protein n=1 Tax=Noviherbaspirillum humi TaxID=1688639 RepID=A0A239IBJ8_9BURK|nr:hypothetical protein [Noviherbaspirillum humi]SNS90792.1 hypothetical protein SAMN06265795_10929 [Noviherbaspirillum humi]